MYIEPLEARIAPALIFGIRNDAHLVEFDSAHPGALLADVALSAPPHANETISNIAFRPSTGQLYAFGRAGGQGYIYTVNPATGVLTEVGSTAFTTAITGGDGGGMSFDPVTDVLRVIDLDGQNFRVNADTGALIAQDTTVQGPAPGINVYGLAYDRNFVGATATTLYGIDYQKDDLVRIGDPNGAPGAADNGVPTLLGPLFSSPMSTSSYGGLTIDARTGAAFAAITTAQGANFYSVDLAGGHASALGKVGDGSKELLGLAAAPGDVKILSDQLATYTDLDGDLVTVKTTGHGLTATGFHFLSGPLGSQLTELDLSGLGLEGKSLTITATPALHGGDGWVNVGTINAPGLALGGVTVAGDLGAINAGDGENSLGSLTVHSLGKLGHSTQAAGTGSLVSTLGGHLGALVVKSDLAGAQVQVTGGASGSIGSVSIGGDLLPASDGVTAAGVSSTGAMGNVFIGGSIVGGNAVGDGSVLSGGAMGSVTIGGSILGGTKTLTGWVKSIGNMGAVKIGVDVVGGQNVDGYSGGVDAAGNLASVTLGGSIIGGAGTDAGIIYTFLGTTNDLGPVTIGGSLLGAGGSYSGSLYSYGKLGSVTIGGSVHGGDGPNSASIEAVHGAGRISIRGDVTAGSGDYAGAIYIDHNGLAGVTIGGSLVGLSGTDNINGIILDDGSAGPIVIGGEIRAATPGGIGIIAAGAYGSTVPAIASITVKGSVRDAVFLAGVVAPNADARIGAVSVGGDWIESSIGAGVTAVGNASDVKDSETVPNAIQSSITSVTIHGYVAGTAGGGGHFGIEAEQVGKVQVGTRVYTLAAGTDKVGFGLGTTGDVRLREVNETAASIPADPTSTPNQLAFTNVGATHTATFLDEDGDLVTLRITGGAAGATLGITNLAFADGPYGSHLTYIDLSAATQGQAWKGASVSLTATPKAGHGDSFVNVGYLDATGVDLGNVSIHGDLGQIDAGDSTVGPHSLGLGSLAVQSLGYFGTGGQIAQGASTESDIQGSMGSLTIAADLARATVKLTGGSVLTSAFIGGDIIGNDTNPENLTVAGGLSVEHTIGALTLGGAAAHSGLVTTTAGAINRLTMAGSVYGGTGSTSGGVDTLGLGPVAIAGDVIGGTSDHTGFVHAAGNIASVTLGGSIIGHDTGGALDSGIIYAYYGATNNVGAVAIGGSLIGSDSEFSGSLNVGGTIASVKIAGSLVGGAGVGSGNILAGATVGSVAIGGDARAAAGASSGSIGSYGSIGSVTIAGSLVGGAGSSGGLQSLGHLGAVAIGGSVRGDGAADPVLIYAAGEAGKTSGIASLTVHGSVSKAVIEAGGGSGALLNPDAGIGAVSIGGDLQASSIAAGVRNLNGFTHIGDGNDSAQDPAPDAILSKIASVTVGGMAFGTPGVADDHFGIVAQIVGKVKVGAATYLLTPEDSLTGLAIGPTGDLTVREV